ncbi:MAG: CPBP family intramembrane metalloprotease [bacterium]|nr:CPBP family intramembrane metalloprotease [bacterium]
MKVEGEGVDEPGLSRGVPLGFIAMAPLWLAYEVAYSQTGGTARNGSEMIMTYLLAPLGDAQVWARRGVLVALGFWALVHCARRHWGIGPLVMRIWLEGILGALALGPLLIFLVGVFGDSIPPLPALGEVSAGDQTLALFSLGGAAWEEIVFRVGLFGLIYLGARELAQFMGVPARAVRGLSEGAAWVLSSLLFAAYHLNGALAWLGASGEPFRPALFTYRFLAGMLLVGLFRWRGPGVAGIGHGVFNLALCLGAGPAVFQ